MSSGSGQARPAVSARFNVSRTVERARPSRRAISCVDTDADFSRITSRASRIPIRSAGIDPPLGLPKGRPDQANGGARQSRKTPGGIIPLWGARSSRNWGAASSRYRGAALSRNWGAASSGISRAAARAQADCGTPSGTGRVVAVDERLDIALQDGRLVRLAGLEAFDPTRVSPETAGAARQFLTERLLGREVELKLLASGTDRWGRALADLSLPEPSGGAGSSVAMSLLSAGYARVWPEFEARDCAAARLAVEDGARRAGLGLWSEPDYAVIQSSDAAALRSRDGQFVVIEGRVGRVGFGRSRLYLDLVPRDGPTIVVARKLEFDPRPRGPTGRHARGADDPGARRAR